MGSPLYASLLDRCAEEPAGAIVREILGARPISENLDRAATALRLMGAVHRLALEGRAPTLAAAYPSCGGDGSVDRAWPAFLTTIEQHRGEVESALDRPIQTNEVARSAALLGGFLLLAERFRLPMRLLELGASAGLNLRWDRFRYQSDDWDWGAMDASVRIDTLVSPGLPFPRDAAVEVVDRRGCDVAPIDPTSALGRIQLRSFVWPDQRRRLAWLDAACEVANAVPAVVDRATASDWLRRELCDRHAGAVTVVYHSVFLQYLSAEERGDVAYILLDAGARATRAAPLAHLTLEPAPPNAPNVLMRLWPGGAIFELARSTLHGRDVRWLFTGT